MLDIIYNPFTRGCKSNRYFFNYQKNVTLSEYFLAFFTYEREQFRDKIIP